MSISGQSTAKIVSGILNSSDINGKQVQRFVFNLAKSNGEQVQTFHLDNHVLHVSNIV
jgi:hypothetical protein